MISQLTDLSCNGLHSNQFICHGVCEVHENVEVKGKVTQCRHIDRECQGLTWHIVDHNNNA